MYINTYSSWTLLPFGHDKVSVDWSPQSDVNASDRVNVSEHQQHGPRH